MKSRDGGSGGDKQRDRERESELYVERDGNRWGEGRGETETDVWKQMEGDIWRERGREI